MSLSHDSIYNYYETNSVLISDHNYSLTEIENMLPYEREIYLALIQKRLKQEQQRLKSRKM